MIKNILFDLGGVLIDLDVRRSLKAMYALTDGSRGQTQITADGLLGGHDSELINKYQVGAITTDEFLSSVLSSCKQGTTKEQVKDAWFAMLLGIGDDKRHLLQCLKDKGLGIYVLSNINELHVEWVMNHCPELHTADALFFSNEIHLSKPDKRCYDLVKERAGINPCETLYIDDLQPNIKAGEEAGFRCLHAKDNNWIREVEQMLL